MFVRKIPDKYKVSFVIKDIVLRISKKVINIIIKIEFEEMPRKRNSEKPGIYQMMRTCMNKYFCDYK